jgi:hypothetical protein
VLSGIRRTIGAAPVRKRAATSDMVIAMSATGASLRALRDRAIILLGFAGVLVALDTEDLEEAPEGLLITIRRSKTDQEGTGNQPSRSDVTSYDAGLHNRSRNRARNWIHSRIWPSRDYFLSTPSTRKTTIVPLVSLVCRTARAAIAPHGPMTQRLVPARRAQAARPQTGSALRSFPEILCCDLGALPHCFELLPHDRRMNFGPVERL